MLKKILIISIGALSLLGIASCSFSDKNDNQPINDFIVQRDQYLWWATNSHLYQLNIVSEELTKFDPLNIENFFVTKQGDLWAYGRTVSFFDGENWIDTNVPYPTSDMLQTQDKKVWIATNGGYFIWDENDQIWKLSQVNLPGRIIAQAPNESILFGLQQDGIIHLENDQITHWTKKNGLADSEVWSLLVTDMDDILAGTRWDIYHWDGESWTSIGDKVGSLDADGSVIYELFKTQSGTLWAATTAGIGRMDDTGWEFYEWGMCGSTVHEFVEISDGSLWVSCQRGLYRWDGKAWHEYGVEKGIIDNSFSHLSQAQSGSLYNATSSGIYELDPTKDFWNSVVEFE